MALDGLVTPALADTGGGTTKAGTLTTTAAGMVFVCLETNNGGPIVSVTSAHLTFSFLSQESPNGTNYIEVWTAVSSGALTSEVITVTSTSSPSFRTLHIFGWSGVSTLDTNASTPTHLPSGNFSFNTNVANTTIFATQRISATNGSAPTGFTEIYGSSGGGWLFTSYKTVSAAQTALVIDVGGGLTHNGAIAWAVQEVATATREQEGFRFRNDDGSETTATWLASQDTGVTQPVSTTTRLRVLTNVTNDPPSEALKLQWRKSGDPSTEWRDVV